MSDPPTSGRRPDGWTPMTGGGGPLPSGGELPHAPDDGPWWGWDESSDPPRHPSPTRIVGALIAVVLAVVLVVGFAGPIVWDVLTPQPAPWVLVATPTPSPVASIEPASPTPSRTPPAAAPTMTPSPRYELPPMEWDPLPTPRFSDELWMQVQGLSLDDEPIAVLSGCPVPQTVSNRIDYEALVREQWHCVHMAWAGRLAELGWSTVEPPIIFYEGTGSPSDCGYFEAPAFYCSADGGTVHFGAGHLEMTHSWDLALNEMVNHEYGHHLQNLGSITTAKMQLGSTDEMERRAELQATCWSAAMTFNNEDVDFDENDWVSWQERLATTLIDGLHGNRESLTHWGTRGLHAETLGDCNTWAVDASEVE